MPGTATVSRELGPVDLHTKGTTTIVRTVTTTIILSNSITGASG